MTSTNETALNLVFLLKKAQHGFRTRVDEALRPLGLTAPQYAVLVAIAAETGVSNAKLARLAFVTPQSMQGLLANLVREGLLQRTAHPHHGRILQNTLTARGEAVLAAARHEVEAIAQQVVAAVGQDQVVVFAGLLTRCIAHLSPHDQT